MPLVMLAVSPAGAHFPYPWQWPPLLAPFFHWNQPVHLSGLGWFWTVNVIAAARHANANRSLLRILQDQQQDFFSFSL